MLMLEPTHQSHGLDPSATLRRPSSGTETLPDLLLIERARAGDERAVEALIRRYSRRLFRTARSVVLDDERAEAAVIDAYLAAFSDLNRYEPTGKFAAWLTRLTFSHARALQRPLGGPRSGQPEATAESNDLERRELEQAIEKLPEVFRIVYVLRMLEGISGIETAACLGLHETTVRTRLFRAHRRMGGDALQRLRATSGVLEMTAERLERIVSRALAQLPRGAVLTASAAAP
jgi:RNA polymerase sigma-70 factor, ECF subfamily